MARRLVGANVALDHGFLDEPVYIAGSIVLTFRRLLWGGLALLSAGAGVLLGLQTEPGIIELGPLALGPGALLPLPLASLALALALQGPKPVSLESQLLERLRAPGRPRREAEAQPEDYVVEAGELGVAEVEVVGYAIDPSSGEPMRDVRVVVENLGLEAEAGVDSSGRYRAALELPRGTYVIKIVGGGGLEIRRLKMRVI